MEAHAAGVWFVGITCRSWSISLEYKHKKPASGIMLNVLAYVVFKSKQGLGFEPQPLHALISLESLPTTRVSGSTITPHDMPLDIQMCNSLMSTWLWAVMVTETLLITDQGPQKLYICL